MATKLNANLSGIQQKRQRLTFYAYTLVVRMKTKIKEKLKTAITLPIGNNGLNNNNTKKEINKFILGMKKIHKFNKSFKCPKCLNEFKGILEKSKTMDSLNERPNLVAKKLSNLMDVIFRANLCMCVYINVHLNVYSCGT